MNITATSIANPTVIRRDIPMPVSLPEPSYVDDGFCHAIAKCFAAPAPVPDSQSTDYDPGHPDRDWPVNVHGYRGHYPHPRYLGWIAVINSENRNGNNNDNNHGVGGDRDWPVAILDEFASIRPH
ncbi:hypothetical protein FB645_002612 [Coemansia sp. IMI 203386]|nr:hypothetical protein FB645_002612 [Coemansia sp. IMI 203386]